ncbi:MAG: alkaline phosphatase family protein [Nitrososphaera sp.]
MSAQRKMLVIGLDSVPAELFLSLAKNLPNLGKMLDRGLFAVLESCHPPITVPAWMVMMSSKTPGRLGIYGFRHRKGSSYSDGWIANSQSVKENRVWDILAKYGKKACLVGVPPTYPPIAVNGNLVSCFLTPRDATEFTYPPSLSQEIRDLMNGSGNYLFDVQFRTDDRDSILKKLYEMTDKRIEVIKYLMKSKDWDYTMFVEIGVDRLHHMFWKYYDKQHPKYVQGNKYESVIPDYYKHLDQKIGELVSLVDDDTYVLVVSDHGTAAMQGAFCINEWLIKEGYLVLKEYPKTVTDIEKVDIVDWEKTVAWGWGGYYARIFLNLKGREPKGIVSMNDYAKIREELKEKLLRISGPGGEKFDNRVFYPEQLYDQCNGQKPDLMIYFDNLFWRSAGTIGHNSLYLSENDTGPDDSVHWMDGIFLLYDKRAEKRIQSQQSSVRNAQESNSNAPGESISGYDSLRRFSIYDVAPIILHSMGIKDTPSDMKGKVPKEVLAWTKQSTEQAL